MVGQSYWSRRKIESRFPQKKQRMDQGVPVRGSKSENRWLQTRHEIFQPQPLKLCSVAPSGSGKTSTLLAAADAIFGTITYWAIFSRSHNLDPAFQDLKQRIRDSYKQRGIEEPFLFENLDSLTKVLADQRRRVQELKDADPPAHRLPMVCLFLDDVGLEATRYSRVLDNAFANSRHYGTNILAGSQIHKSLSKSIRVNMDVLCVHRLPAVEYESVESEVVGAWVNRQQFAEIYSHAVNAHSHGFLTIRLKSRDKDKVFAQDFSKWLVPS